MLNAEILNNFFLRWEQKKIIYSYHIGWTGREIVIETENGKWASLYNKIYKLIAITNKWIEQTAGYKVYVTINNWKM